MADIESFIYFALIYNHLAKKIHAFGFGMMKQSMTFATGIALTLVTLWIFVHAYRMMSGQVRVSAMHSVSNMARITVVIAAASSMTVANTDIHDWLTKGLDKEIHGLVTGNPDSTTSSTIDKNLAYMQIAMSVISQVQITDGDYEMRTAKERAMLGAAIGTAGPPMVAGAMLILYQFAMAIFIGLGPLFILCLIFDSTKDLFRRWLLYGIGTLFSMALLSVVTSIALGIIKSVAIEMWFSKIANALLSDSIEGLSHLALQQGGIGLLLTILIVSVPPMAANFFQGTLGSFMSHSAFGQGAGGMQGHPGTARSMGGGGMGLPALQQQNALGGINDHGSSTQSHGSRVAIQSYTPQADATKAAHERLA